MITTTKGLMDEKMLEKREGSQVVNGNMVNWIEYWTEGELIHRSVHVVLSPQPTSILQGSF